MTFLIRAHGPQAVVRPAILLMIVSGAISFTPARAAAPTQTHWEVLDLASQNIYKFDEPLSRLTSGEPFEVSPEGAQLKVSVESTPGADLTSIRIHLENLSSRDRGLTLRVTLALPAAAPWRFWHDLDNPERLGSAALADLAAVRELPALPEFSGGERPDVGSYSVYPLGVVDDGTSWVAWARPAGEPALMRFLAQGGTQGSLTAEVDLALSGFAADPGKADVRLLYLTGPSTAETAMRDAVERYDRQSAGPLTPRATVFGAWMPFEDLAKFANVDEFGFGYQEGAINPSFDDKLGVLSLYYFAGAGESANVPAGTAGAGSDSERVTAAFRRAAEQHTGVADAWDRCAARDANGRVIYSADKVYSDYFAPICLEPMLPYGQAMRDQIVKRLTVTPSPSGIDGCYIDGISTGLDYSPEHMRAARHLLLWDGSLRRPFNFNLWSSVDWAGDLHDRLQGTGKLIMLNDATLAEFPFISPDIDVFGSELGLALARPVLRQLRVAANRRPVCTLLKGDFVKITQAEIESYMRRCAAYGVLPGFFDLSPSGLHPGSSYWVHPEWYDRDRPLFRRYLPLARELARAGWEPRTGAKVDGAGAWIERFGPDPDSLWYLTVSTDPGPPSAKPTSVKIQLSSEESAPTSAGGSGAPAAPPAPGQGAGRIAVELLTGRIADPAGGISMDMGPEDLSIWALGSRHAQSEGYLERARDLLERRQAYLSARADRTLSLAPWVPYEQGIGAALDTTGRSGGFCLRLTRGAGAPATGVVQTVTLANAPPRPIVVTGWSRARTVSGLSNADYGIYVDCYYQDRTALYGSHASFATGTHDWQSAQVRIEPTKPVQSITVYLLLRGDHTGTAWFDDISIAWADAAGKNLVARGDFEDKTPPSFLESRDPAAGRINGAAAQLASLLAAPPESTHWDRAAGLCDEIQSAMPGARKDPDLDRTKRDLEDLRWDLDLARKCLDGKAQPATRTSRLTPPAVLGSGK